MKRGQGVHVIPKKNNGKNWAVELNGKNKKSFTTQKAAIPFATKLAKKQETELVLHGRDGKIRERNSYGNDPHPPKG